MGVLQGAVMSALSLKQTANNNFPAAVLRQIGIPDRDFRVIVVKSKVDTPLRHITCRSYHPQLEGIF
jgi:hypothetical protein